MSDTEEVVEEVVEEVGDPIETEASSKGWDPSKGSKTAQEFLDYEEDYSQRKKADKKLSKENKELRQRLDRMENSQNIHLTEQRKFLTSRIDTLKTNRDSAMESGQGDIAKEIQQQLDSEQEILATLPENTVAEAPNMDTGVIDNWVEQNPWIDDGSEKAQFAKDLFQELNHAAAQKISPHTPQSVIDAQWRRMLRQVNNEVAEEFGEEEAPNKGARKRAPTRVNGKRTAEQAVSTRDIKQLRQEDKKMYKILVKSDTNPNGTYTSAEFFKELDKANAARGVV